MATIAVIKELFPDLLQSYYFAVNRGFHNNSVSLEGFNKLQQCLKNCEKELHFMNDYINTLISSK
jgi:uncharacterized protein YutD